MPQADAGKSLLQAMMNSKISQNAYLEAHSTLCTRLIVLCLLRRLALSRLQAFHHASKKFIPWLRAGELQDKASGVPGYSAAHINDAAHNGFHSAPGRLLKSQGLGKDHVLADDLEHVVNQHPHFQEGAVYRKLTGRQPFNVELAFKFRMILLTCAALPVGLQNIFFCRLKACPGRKNDYLGRPQKLPIFALDLSDFKNHAHRRLDAFNRTTQAAPIDHFVRCALNNAPVLLASSSHLVLLSFRRLCLMIKPVLFLFTKSLINSRLSKPESATRSTGSSINWSVQSRLCLIKSIVPAANVCALAGRSLAFTIHPPPRWANYWGKSIATVISKARTFFFGVRVVKDSYIKIQTHPRLIINPGLFGLNSHFLAERYKHC